MESQAMTNFEELGQNLLDNFVSTADTDSSAAKQTDSPLFLHLVELSTFLKELAIPFSTKASFSSSKNMQFSKNLVDQIMKDLISINRTPSYELQKPWSINDAYRILSYTLFLSYQTQQMKYQHLKDKLRDLQNSYDEILQQSNAPPPKLPPNFFAASDQSFSDDFEKLNLNNENDEKLLRLMSSRFDQLNNEMHLLNLKNSDQESEIERLKQENMNLELQIDHLKQKAYNYQPNDMIPKEEIDDTTNARIFVLENDIDALKIRLKDINSTSEKRKEKIKTLTKIVQEKDSKLQASETEIESLKIKVDRLTLENEDKIEQLQNANGASSVYEELAFKNEEISNLNFALNELSAQMEGLNNELARECNLKNNLFNITQKMTIALTKQENVIKSLIESTTNTTDHTDNSFNILNKTMNSGKAKNKEPNDQGNLIEYDEKIKEDVRNFLYDNYNDDNDIMKLILGNNDSKSSTEFIHELLHHVIEIKNSYAIHKKENEINNEVDSKKCQRLLCYMNNILRFIDQIANSGEIQNWLIDTTNEQTVAQFREALFKQCAKIDGFLKENGFDEFDDENNLDDDFLGTSQKLSEMPENPSPQELFAVIKMQTSANEFLRRFSEELKIQNSRLLSDVRSMRFDLSDLRASEEEKANERIDAIQQQLDREKEKSELLDKLTNFLRTAYSEQSNKTSSQGRKRIIKMCLRIIEDKEVRDDLSNGSSDNNEDYIQALENKIRSMKEKNMILFSKVKHLRSQLNKQKIQFTEEFDNSQRFNDDLTNSIIEKERSLSSLKDEIEEKTNKIKSLTGRVEALTNQISDLQEAHKNEISTNSQEHEKKLAIINIDNENMINKMKNEYEDTINELNSKLRETKLTLKSEIKKMETESEIEAQKSKEIRIHFEALTTDLKEKLKEIRERESNEKNEKQKIIGELNEVKNQLSKCRIENRMISLKLQTNEEKYAREKQLAETQNKMKLIKVITEKDQKINELKESSELEFHYFLRDIFSIFKEFMIDFSIPISRESVMDLLEKVNETLNNVQRENRDISDTLKNVYKILNIKTKREEFNLISILTNKINNSNNTNTNSNSPNSKNQITSPTTIQNSKNDKNGDVQNSTRNWEIWARRLHALITDNFSTVKSSKELMSAIEESLMSAIGQRQIFRKMEILRAEKILLAKGVSNKRINAVTEKKRPISIIQIMAIMASIRRMQRLSGHLKSVIGLRDENTTIKQELAVNNANNENNILIKDDADINENDSGKKNYPILCFVD
ncbi:hypothetical protein TRFO_11929 [Tritrichomonas foetus]|uniref:Viral A-type inclusion protein n=1 Tax=Tritrichomonas foetus TaxID=1144522 RepID=A0A1J4J122_9EUKA|nr:hypothetical protein TRFO_11929 [Tritrichomonas foetus]|eukprot:OHS93302.1 hypothetical protein TRFO_11929 [Tritrichomonas foetus]